MRSHRLAISLLFFFILNAAAFSVPAATPAATTYTVQIESIMPETLVATCDINGRSLPTHKIKILKQANFTVHLRDDKDDAKTMTCDLRSGDKHGKFVMFDSRKWNVSSYCAPGAVCRWKVVSEGICLFVMAAFDCLISYYWT
nr:hypothetical protein A4A49_61654 [Ipomoea trifida]